MAQSDIEADIVVCGGGLGGLALAIGLARGGFRVVVVDANRPADVLAPEHDGRSSAVAYASAQLLKALDIWPHIVDFAQPIDDIRVTDGPSRFFVHFDQRELGDGALGYMLENRHIRHGLHQAAATTPGLVLIAPAKVESVVRDAGFATATLNDGRVIRARLACACDGRRSAIRAAAGIKTFGWSYRQTAIIATIAHQLSHQATAHERFLADGPFAILPLTGNRSSLVWTVPDKMVETIMALDDRSFAAEIGRRVGDFLGALEVLPMRWAFPLDFRYATHYVEPRLALVADAAHGIHPIAGQGLNLGLRDVAALIEVLVDAARLGLDIGDIHVLERYQRWRRTDSVVMGLVTDGLNRLFSNNIPPIRLARDLGLGLVNRLPPVKRLLMRQARGTTGGRMPKLLAGHSV